jgi:hypothetical protein
VDAEPRVAQVRDRRWISRAANEPGTITLKSVVTITFEMVERPRHLPRKQPLDTTLAFRWRLLEGIVNLGLVGQMAAGCSLIGPTYRLAGCGGRKVRAPKDAVMGNAHRP